MMVTRSRVTARHRGGNAILKETTLMLNGHIHYALRIKLPVVSYENDDTWKARTHETGGHRLILEPRRH